jgi:uncharacterized OsmC-like protein
MLEYEISALSENGGKAQATAKKTQISFDASSGQNDTLPNPAELLLTSLAACILKNIQRYCEKLHYPYKKALVKIHGFRNDNPPFMSKIIYEIMIDTDIDDRKLNILHKNILKFGTITNTLAKSCEINGKIEQKKL